MVQKKRKAASVATEDLVHEQNKPKKQKAWIDF